MGFGGSDLKNTSELKAWGERNGMTKKKLTMADIARMGSAETQWHSSMNKEHFEAAVNEPARKAKAAEQRLSDMWGGKLGPEVDEAAHNAGKQFCQKYPQFIQDETNAWALHSYMKANNLDGTEVESYVTAFQALAARGDLHLNPTALGLGTETRISGHSVKTHPELHLLLRPAPTPEQLERMKAAKMSADEWKKSRPELQHGIPFVVQQQFFKAAHSLASFEPEYIFNDGNNAKILAEITKTRGQFNLTGLRAAFQELKKRGELELKPISVSGQVVTHTEYEPRETSEPEAPGKLRAKVARMSSGEMAQFLRENPSARRAIDGV